MKKNNTEDKKLATKADQPNEESTTKSQHKKVEGGASSQLQSEPRKKSLFKKVLIGLFLIILGVLIFWLGNNWQKLSQKLNLSSSSAAYSENQQRVISNFGLPQTFTIAQQDGQRLETWKYIYLDEMFVFQDGEFVARQHFNFDLETEEGLYLDLEPKDFYQLQLLAEINKLLDREPSFEAQIEPAILAENYYFYSYDDFLNVMVDDGKIISVQTAAFAMSSEANDQSAEKPGEKPGKDFVANTADADNSYSYYLNDPIYRLIKQRSLESMDESGTLSYAYCYSLDEGASFDTEPQDPWACADEESMVWIIELIPLAEYDALDEVDLMGQEELTRNDSYVYTITHLNGDLPEGLPVWPKILQDVEDDFSAPMAEEYADVLGL